MNQQNQPIEIVQDIRNMMQRSSKFLSLSGWSGIAAGLFALIGSYIAYRHLDNYMFQYAHQGYAAIAYNELEKKLLLIALLVLAAALLSAFFFTSRRASKNRLPLWDHTSRLLLTNILIPLVTGGLFILALLQYNEVRFVVPACLTFYGLALVNGSKYTLGEIRYLGIFEIVLGLISTQFIEHGLYFWAFGFGVLHLIYGFIMWNKYERH